ncbi:MAG: M1 family aminopeptidase [Chloroflexi bacterium]|nr:M1 family aminopeptidase [Chloroflexota bacterium]
MFRILIVAVFCIVPMTACNLNKLQSPPNPVSADSGLPGVESAAVTASPTPAEPTPLATAPPTSTLATENRCHADAGHPTRGISADVDIDYENKTVVVFQRVRFLNREPAPIEEVILDVQANQWEDIFFLEDLRVDEQDASYRLDRNRLQVQLAETLQSGCWLEIALRFRLQPAAIGDGLRSYRGFLGYSSRQLNLGHFLPTAAARLDGAWRIHEPVGIGEQIVYEVADWQVNLNVRGASASLQLAAPGTVRRVGDGRWSVQLRNSRDFALSLSEEFVLREQELANGVTLAVYAFADAVVNDRGLEMDGAAHVLGEAAKSLDTFARLFGHYPWDRLVIVQGDFPDGMEFSGLVFVGSGWFYGFDGTTRNYLTLISVHEVAHQWWYARVGNDAALNPWLDEALATYSEYLFIEANYPADKNWWWTFRVAVYFPQGSVDYPVYEFNTPREYINAIYLRGAQMLQNLREDIGDEAFFEMLRAYYVAGDARIADPSLFWRQLSPELLPLTEATRRDFLAHPAIDATIPPGTQP